MLLQNTDYIPCVVQKVLVAYLKGFPGGSDGKESPCNAGDPALIPGSGGSPGKVNATHSSIPA